MQKWIVRYDDEITLDLLKNLGLISYIPALHETLKFVFIETELTEEEILRIQGITSAALSRNGTLNV